MRLTIEICYACYWHIQATLVVNDANQSESKKLDSFLPIFSINNADTN